MCVSAEYHIHPKDTHIRNKSLQHNDKKQSDNAGTVVSQILVCFFCAFLLNLTKIVTFKAGLLVSLSICTLQTVCHCPVFRFKYIEDNF